MIAFWAIFEKVFWLTITGRLLLMERASSDIVEKLLLLIVSSPWPTFTQYWQLEKVLLVIVVPEELDTLIHIPLALFMTLLITFIVLDAVIPIVLHMTGTIRFNPSITISLELAISIRSKLGLLAGPQSDPYRFIVIGSHTSPFALLRVRVSFQVSLQRSDTVSHGRSDVAFTLEIVCQAVLMESPSLASLQSVALT
jgi:hypothetical protein